MSETDWELLQRYRRNQTEEAFAELVRRHVNLVYSAALRQIRAPQLAEEIAQSVFSDLARQAAQLPADTVLAAWLHQVTRRTAIDVVRREARRQLREQIATEMNATHTPDANWTHIEPLLDEAVSALDDTDRAAVVLRYFENKSLREVGQQLGVSDDAAQKRVSRAVERLREFFYKRGVTVGASGLAVVISANAVQAAPMGLAVAISTAAVMTGTTLAATATVTATKAIAMTALQKTIVTTTIAVLAGAGIYEARQASQLRAEVQTLQQQQVPLRDHVAQLNQALIVATNKQAILRDDNELSNRNTAELLKLRGEIARLRFVANAGAATNPINSGMESEINFWIARVNKLKDRLEKLPDQRIPEFEFMNERGWMFASQLLNSDSDGDFDNAIKTAQACAKRNFADALHEALKKFMAENNQAFPSDLSLIQPYFSNLADPAVFRRYEAARAHLVTEVNPMTNTARQFYRVSETTNREITSPEEWVIIEKSPIHDDDAQIVVTTTGVRLQWFGEK